MFFKKIKKIMLLLLIILPTNILAYSEYIIAGGENIGIELNSKGVMVVGVYKVGNIYPAKTAGIKVGDVITNINDIKIDNVMELVSRINELDTSNIKITYIRNDIENYTNLTLYKDNDIYKTGLYVKDNVIGIGTLTFIDPNTKIFGALGHEIIESTSGVRLEIKDGKIFESEVTDISKSSVGSPGEKNAKYDKSSNLGTVYENTINGVFGYYNEVPDKKLYKVAKYDEIKLGDAKILTVLSGSDIKEYNIKIIKINENLKVKNILFEITDEELMKKTGGIVQGMSGSPIIQNNNIIGAVTHVIVDNPKRGYGVLITKMLEEAEN